MAIVVPNVDVIKSWAMENHIPGTLTVLCNDSNVKELIVSDMLAWGKDGGLKSFEQVRRRVDGQLIFLPSRPRPFVGQI